MLDKWMLLGKIIARNGYRVVLDPAEPHDFSVKIPSDQGRFVVNAGHLDNLKTTVAQQWLEVSHQKLEVDPLLFHGPMVEKSNINATHDGRVMHGPIPKEKVMDGKVYQRLIDNSLDDMVVDLRVPLHGGRIPLVYRKLRPIAKRFDSQSSSVEVVETNSVLSSEEQSTLQAFAKHAGLDYGEADVLRDNAHGQIWVVDSTEGPGWPPRGMSLADAGKALTRVAAAFDAMVEAGIEKHSLSKRGQAE